MAPSTRRTRAGLPVSRALLLAVAAAIVLLTSACDWPMFRLDTGRLAFTGDTGPKNVASLSLRFSGATGGPIVSSPAVVNGVVYVGSEDGKLYAFDAAGTTSCSTGTPRICMPLWSGATGGAINSSPALAYGNVYIGSRDGKLYAFDAAGTHGCSGTPKVCTPLWATPASTTIDESSPAIANGVVYIGSTDELDAIDARSGARLSHFMTNGFIEASPAIANGFVYVGSADHTVYALG
jgi:hypothetical protein